MSGFELAWRSRYTTRSRLLLGAGLVIGPAVLIALLPLPWVVLVVLGGILVVVTLVQPRMAVLLVAVAIPFGSLWQASIGAMRLGATDLLLFLLFASWLMRMIARREVRLVWPPLALPVFIFIMALAASALITTSLQHSIKEIAKWVEFLALYLFVANEFDERWTKALVAVLMGTGAVAALHGIYQFLFQVGPEGFVLFDRFMRAYGTFEQPNPYAGFLGLSLPLTIGLLGTLLLPRQERVSGRWLLWAGLCGTLMFVALVMSWSRGAWLGFSAAVAGIALAVAVRNGRSAIIGAVLALLLVCVLLVGGWSLLPQSLVQRFSDFVPYLGLAEVRGLEITDANFAVLERMAHWQAALDMWTDHPWLGVGIGNYEVAYARYALPLWALPLGHAHNYYLNIAAEAGILGLLAYLFLWGSALLGVWRSMRRASGWFLGIAFGVIGVLVHLSIHNLFDNLYVHAMYLQVAILLGISATNPMSKEIPSSPLVGGTPGGPR